MTTKTLTGNYPGGYSLKAAYYGLELASSAKVGGAGVNVGHTASVANFGTIAAVSGDYAGLYLANGGTVDNYAAITGYVGIKTHTTAGGSPVFSSIDNAGYVGGNYAGIEMGQVGYVSNFASIHGARYGVDLVAYGTMLNLGTVSGGDSGVEVGSHGAVCNGLGGRTSYQITGTRDGVSTVASNARVTNYATITGGQLGVYLGHSGTLVNGPFSDEYAKIQGATGVSTNGSTALVVNYGTISGTGGAGSWGVNLYAGGALYNYDGAITGFSGLNDGFAGLVLNVALIEGLGAVAGSYGVVMVDGGKIYNGLASGAELAVIRGYAGIVTKHGGTTITNYGLIQATGKYADAVDLTSGSVVNGSAKEKGALITGGSGITFQDFGTVVNQGSIVGNTGSGIAMGVGGSVTNGAAGDKTALISGGSGGILSYGLTTVVNFGTVESSGGYLAAIYSGFGGQVTNGSAKDATALISGAIGVRSEGYAETVLNFGTITATGGTNAYGVYLGDGGSVTNGATNATSARIQGYGGVDLVAGGTVTNFGTVQAMAITGTAGVNVGVGGGTVINGSAKDVAALIGGAIGVASASAAATVKNFATVMARDFGVLLGAGGSVTNGSAAVATALIEGYTGLDLQGGASASNFGTVVGNGTTFGYGVKLSLNDSLVNGSASDSTALVSGRVGVTAYQGSTVTNFGTIQGTVGDAVEFTSPGAKLVVEAGSKFIGQVYGDGGALVLASGTGKLSGSFASGDITVYGSMPSTTFTDFDSLTIWAGAAFSQKAGVSISGFQTVDDVGALGLGGAGKNSVVNAGLIETTGSGALTVGGAVTNTGTLAVKGGAMIVDGAVSGAGVATVTVGTLDLKEGFTQNVTFTGSSGVLELGQSQGYTGTITGFSKTGGTSLDLADISFVSSTEATYSGNKSGGVLTVTDGMHTATIVLKGNYTASTFVASSDLHGGTIVVDPQAPSAGAAPALHSMIAAMAAMGAPGAVSDRSPDTLPAREPFITAPHVASA